MARLAVATASAFVVGCGGLPKDLTVTPRIQAPPAGQALVNFHRPSKWGGKERFAIFNGEGTFLVDIPGGSQFQYVCDPGEQIFLAWADQASAVKADLASDEVYDIMVDVSIGWIRGNIKLIPLTKDAPRRAKLLEFEKREKVVLQTRTAHIEEYERLHAAKVQEIKRDFIGGEKSERVQVLRPEDCR